MSGGLLQSAQGLLASVLALAHTRLELFSTELQEELMRLFFAALGAAVAALALVIALGEEHRALAAALIGGAFFAFAAGAGWSMRRVTQDKPQLLGASLAELQRDHDVVRP